jgi:hypothetical protein
VCSYGRVVPCGNDMRREETRLATFVKRRDATLNLVS